MSSKKPTTSGTSPAGRKLVQARLPFKTVTPKSTPTSPIAEPTPNNNALDTSASDSTRKRKRSMELNRPAKVNKTSETKENIVSSADDKMECQVILIDSDTEDLVKPPKDEIIKTPASSKKRGHSDKTPQPNKKTPRKVTPRTSSKKRKASSPVDTSLDDDDVVEKEGNALAGFAIKLPVPKKRLSTKAKTPTRQTKSESENDLIIADEDSEMKSPSKKSSPTKPTKKTPPPNPKSVSPKKSTTPKKGDKSPLPSSPTKVLKTASIKSPIKTPHKSTRVSRSRSASLMEKTIKDGDTESSTGYEHVKKQNTDKEHPDEKDQSESIHIVDDSSNDSRLDMTVSIDSDRNGIDQSSSNATPKRTLASNAIQSDSACNFTPKQMQRKVEADNRLKDKLRQKEEKEEQRRREKEDREKKRLDEIEAKNEDKKRKEEQKEEERKRKEEQKEEERKRKEEQKEEERKRKEEQKEEERRKREDEKLAKEEADKKKNQKTSAAFTKFFVKQSTQKISPATGGESNDAVRPQNFMAFCVKEDMKLAPTVRRVFSENHRSEFDKTILVQKKTLDRKDLYIEQLKNESTKRGRAGKTWVSSEADVMIVDDELEGASAIIEEPKLKQTYQAKFLKFHENRRPAYYGTWRKSSKVIKPRTPFKTDNNFFDYEVDSDDEWEDEEPGESLHGSDDEKDKESDDDYDIDNEFFVPHGHLSDEEVLSGDEADDDDNTPETQKAKLKIVQMEFADEMKKKTEKIKPRLIGLVYRQTDGSLPQSCVSVIGDMLRSRAMIFQGQTISLKKPTAVIESADGDDDSKPTANKRRVLHEENVADLIRLLHGNVTGKAFLIREFVEFLKIKHNGDDAYKATSNSMIRMRISEIAKYQSCPDEGELQGKFCWYVSPEIREQYGVLALGIPNTWEYTLEKPSAKSEKKVKPTEVDSNVVEENKPAKSRFNISNFTKVLSEEDKGKNFVLNKPPRQESANSPSPKTTPAPAGNTNASLTKSASKSGTSGVIKKRVSLLMSVPRGEAIPDTAKNALISNFLKNTSAPHPTAKTTPDSATSETIILD